MEILVLTVCAVSGWYISMPFRRLANNLGF